MTPTLTTKKREGEYITENGFVSAVMKADEKKAVDCRAVKARFQNKDIGYLMGTKPNENTRRTPTPASGGRNPCFRAL